MINTPPLNERDLTCLWKGRKVFSEFIDYFFHYIQTETDIAVLQLVTQMHVTCFILEI